MKTLPRLRESLSEYRAAGADFEDAWPLSLKRLRSEADRALIRETEEAWRRAYSGEPPTRSERAAASLASLLGP